MKFPSDQVCGPAITIRPQVMGRVWPIEMTISAQPQEVVFSCKVDCGLSQVPTTYRMPRSLAVDLYKALGEALVQPA